MTALGKLLVAIFRHVRIPSYQLCSCKGLQDLCLLKEGSNLVMCREGGIEGGGGIEGEGMVFVLGRGRQRWTFKKTTKTCTDQHPKKRLWRANMS